MQTSYDTRLNNATYDALKAFQLNTINSDTSDLANSKLRDIEASVNTFFNSVASNFNMAGYNQDILKEYVPALVYTMYDGYYIYSPYTNTLDSTNSNDWIVDENTGETISLSDAEILSDEYNSDAAYKEGDKISGLKPYIYYSCRYVKGGIDVTITYTLDNYITIQGTINGQGVYDYGYLLDNITLSENGVSYRDVAISSENTSEWVYDPDTGEMKIYQYIKVNGVKYYYDGNSHSWFAMLTGKKYPQPGQFNITNSAAINYYTEANEFTNRVKRIRIGRIKR